MKKNIAELVKRDRPKHRTTKSAQKVEISIWCGLPDNRTIGKVRSVYDLVKNDKTLISKREEGFKGTLPQKSNIQLEPGGGAEQGLYFLRR